MHYSFINNSYAVTLKLAVKQGACLLRFLIWWVRASACDLFGFTISVFTPASLRPGSARPGPLRCWCRGWCLARHSARLRSAFRGASFPRCSCFIDVALLCLPTFRILAFLIWSRDAVNVIFRGVLACFLAKSNKSLVSINGTSLTSYWWSDLPPRNST